MIKSGCILIVGYGNMGKRHALHLKKISNNFEIVFLSHNSFGKSDEYYVSNDLNHVLKMKQPFAAIISNAAPFHCNIACKLISLGIHVLIEKPLADQCKNGSKLYNYSLKYPDVVILIGYHLRYKPGYKMVKSVLQTERIGDLYFAKAHVGHYLPLWRPTDYSESVSAKKSLGGGVLLELSHEYDYIKDLFGSPTSITCQMKKISDLNIDVEDVAITIFGYNTPFIVEIHQDMFSLPPMRCLKVVGHKGYLSWDIRKDLVKYFLNKEQTWHTLLESDKFSKEQPYVDEIRHFLACIVGDEQPEVTIKDGYETLKLIELAKISFKEQATIRVNNGKF